MSGKLLNKTLRIYTIYSVLVLLVSAPLFYFLADKLFIDDADEALRLRSKEFRMYSVPTLKISDLATWNKFNRDFRVETRTSTKDSLFYQFFYDTLDGENEPYRVLTAPVMIEGNAFTFTARINLVESEDMIKSIALLFCTILSCLLIGFYFITRYLSTRLWRPFYSTLDQVEKFELDRNVRIDFNKNNVEEFTRLNQSISRLLERNVQAYGNQKEFIENAAHELQTPLAFLQAKLDTLAQRMTFTDELAGILSELNESVSRLSRINRNLLLLSKIGNNQFESSDHVSVTHVLDKASAFLREQAVERGIRVEVVETGPMTIHANAALLEIAISNLLVNALRHNVQGGQIEIRLTQNSFTISNTGNASLDVHRLFQRFSAHRSADGTGLGLAILKRICDFHGWTISYYFSEGLHNFHIKF